MNTQLIIDWINSTRQINNSKKEYFSFVQLYFLLNHVFKELSTLNNLSYHEDVKIMTLAFPTVVNTNWNTVNANQQIKDDIKFIQFLMFKNIDFAISKNFYSRKSENNLFTEIIKIGYHDDIHSYNSNHNLTKSEIKHYNTILTFEKVSQQKTFKFLQDTLIILYAIRNNYYHGEKQQIEGQIDLLFYLNFVIIKILKIVFSVQNQLNDVSISTEINNIEQNYNSILTDKLKKELKERFRNNQTDFREWEDSANSGNPYFRFAHNFIIIEKFNNLIIKTLNNKNDEIINSIKRI